MDNLAEYRHPRLYDLENPEFGEEGQFLLEMAQALGGPLLELGCGTGRMTIPLARAGIEIIGLDPVPEMLALGREKAGDLPITWIAGDARDFHLGRQFRLIFECGAVFMHMLTRADQRAFLACAREHLAPEGRFVVSLLFPHLENLTNETEEKEWYTYQDEHGRTVRVGGMEVYDELSQVKTETAYRRIQGGDGAETLIVAPLSLRMTFPQEMEGLLENAGLRIIERYGGADCSPLTNASQFMLYVCARA